MNNPQDKPDKTEDIHDKIDRGVRQAIYLALKRHALLGEEVAIWRDGKVVILPASEAILNHPEAQNEDKSSDK